MISPETYYYTKSVLHFNPMFTEPEKFSTDNKNIRIDLKKPLLNVNWKNKTILIAEDEEANFIYLKAALKTTEVKIIWAANGKEAIDKFKKNAVDLILMDIKMPLIDGLEATRKIKSQNSKIPIIAQTAYALERDRDTCYAAGCDEYLVKPITRKTLLEVLSQYFE